MPGWSVDLIGKKLRHVGTIEAPTAEDAINEAAKLFDIASAVRDKLVATKVETKSPEPLAARASF